MVKNFRDKIAISGITVLIMGVALLIFTFISAYMFLTQSLSIIASEDLVRTFGEALAPLIATCIRVMYLGVMGWVSSLLTIRGITLISHAPQLPTAIPQKQPMVEQKPQPQPQKPKVIEKPKEEKPREEKPKEEVKPPEPEFVLIPPEQVSQPQPQPQQNQEPQQDNSSQQPSNH